MADLKVYRCASCGQMLLSLKDSACTPMCCGAPMEQLVAGATDGAAEKHVPVVSVSGESVEVTVGSVEHPMLEKHSIQWIAYTDGTTLELRHLKPGEAPRASFERLGDGGTVYEYCNLHGLWKAEA